MSSAQRLLKRVAPGRSVTARSGNLLSAGNWAERNNVTYASYRELAATPRATERRAQQMSRVSA